MVKESKAAAVQKRRKDKKQMRPWRRIFILLLFALAGTLILSFNIMPAQVDYEVGMIATEDLFYKGNTTSYSSQIKTLEARMEAASEVELIYEIDDTITDQVLAAINESFTAIDSVLSQFNLELEDKIPLLREALPGTYSDEQLAYVLNATTAERISLRQTLSNAFATVYQQGVREEGQGILAAKDEISAAILASSLSEEGKQFLLSYLAGSTLPANEFVDNVRHAVAVEEAMDAVPWVQVTVQNGERLVTQGTPVTDEQIEKLTALGMYSQTASYLPYAGLLVVVFTMYILLAFYLNQYQKKVFAQDRMVVLLGVILTLVLLLSKLIAWIGVAADTGFMNQIGYLMPIAAASMLVAVLLGRNLAIFITIMLSVFAGIISSYGLNFTIVALGGGLAGIISTARLNQRSQFVGASIYIALVNILLIGAWGALNNYEYNQIGVGMLFGLINGFLSAILAMGILPFLETAFSVTTEVRLLELANSNHPLLKRLMVEAPGTYNHSVLVGNLAEAAANAIGADPLIVRVGAYYHDIGKLKRPYFFIENQNAGDNPHDKLQPALSAMIISSHVKDGIEMLREQKIPEEIIDLAEQHHGTSFMGFFYHKALEQAVDKDSVREQDFRYPFRKPQTKEAALLLLADSAQAAVQALKNPTRGQIEETVQNIIKGKTEDDQLQECPITFQDLNLISQAFMTVLSGVNHSRIIYPDQVAKEVGGSIDARLLDDTKAGLKTAAAPAEIAAAGGESDAEAGKPLEPKQ